VPEHTEIIVIDRGSTDGTRSYLAEISERAAPVIKLIFLDTEKDYDEAWCRAVNRGLKEAKGGYLVVVRNDVMVGFGWIEGLRECMEATPDVLSDIKKVGLVSPVTNRVRHKRQSINVHYSEFALDQYVRQHKDRYNRNWMTSAILSDFCLMMHRDCYKEVGDLDETCAPNGFHENDLALRAQEKGWSCIIAGDVFVHRLQPLSLNGASSKREGVHTGAFSFREKWRIRNAGPKCLVAMYRVKNSEDTIQASLDATAKFADHIVVLDDWSTDETSRICKEHPAVSCYEYQEKPFDERRDRNRIMELATRFNPDWVISVDSDEIFEMDRRRAERLMNLNDPHIKALGFHWYTFWEPTHTYFRQDGALGQTNGFRMYKWEPGQSIVLGTPEGLHCGNIPQFPEGAHRFTNIRVRHLGYDTEEKRQAKFRFYQEVDKDPKEFLVGSKDYSHLISPTVVLRMYEKVYGITLCVITKNEERMLDSFLSFFEPFVEEICIVDTGSTDSTLEIARHYTDKIERFRPGRIELDQARNHAIAMAAHPWILCLDPDEEFSFWDMWRLHRLTDDYETLAYSFEVINYQKEGSSVMTTAMRLFRNDHRIYFSYPIHETIEKSISLIPNVIVKSAPFPIHHYGFLKDDMDVQKKLEAYLVRNREYRRENPDEPLPWYNEALHYLNEGRVGEAVAFLNKALELDPTFPAPYGQLAYIHQENAIYLWERLLKVMPENHPGRRQAEQTLQSLKPLTPQRHLVGETRRRLMDAVTEDG
jgi:glycosyltransferase involved in cell wall biosynthesis